MIGPKDGQVPLQRGAQASRKYDCAEISSTVWASCPLYSPFAASDDSVARVPPLRGCVKDASKEPLHSRLAADLMLKSKFREGYLPFERIGSSYAGMAAIPLCLTEMEGCRLAWAERTGGGSDSLENRAVVHVSLSKIAYMQISTDEVGVPFASSSLSSRVRSFGNGSVLIPDDIAQPPVELSRSYGRRDVVWFFGAGLAERVVEVAYVGVVNRFENLSEGGRWI